MKIRKNFEYKGYNFKMTIELYSETQNGIWHTLTIESLAKDNYYQRYIIKDREIELAVILYENIAKAFIDDLLGEAIIEDRFKKLGFK